MKKKQTINPEIDIWIYWRYKGDNEFNKSYVQNIVDSIDGKLLELTTDKLWSNYPRRVLRKEIYIVASTEEEYSF